MSYIKQIVNSYPIINNDWAFREDNLFNYTRIVIGNKTVNLDITLLSLGGIHEYFVRYSDYDDDRYVIDRNKDPWNRKFFIYKTEKVNISNLNVIINNKYRCIPLIDTGGKALMYVITSSVNKSSIYCLDIITNNCVVP